MKAQCRMRKYGNEWLAWYRLYQGEVKPLASDHPLGEIKIAESMDKLQTMYERHFQGSMPMFKVIGFLACEIQERAKIIVKERTIDAGPNLAFHQSAQVIELDTLHVDVMDDDGKWNSMEMVSHGGRWYDITGKVKEGFLMEGALNG